MTELLTMTEPPSAGIESCSTDRMSPLPSTLTNNGGPQAPQPTAIVTPPASPGHASGENPAASTENERESTSEERVAAVVGEEDSVRSIDSDSLAYSEDGSLPGSTDDASPCSLRPSEKPPETINVADLPVSLLLDTPILSPKHTKEPRCEQRAEGRSLPSALQCDRLPKLMTASGLCFYAVPILCSLLTFILHVSTIVNGSFIWDDRAAVLSNPDVLGERSIAEMLRFDFWGQDMALETSHKSWRPAAVLSLRLSHHLHGLNARGFHLDNVLLHAFVTVCYSVLCFQLTTTYTKQSEKRARAAAILASVLFSIHPIHVESVASIVGRADLLCGLFFLTAIMLYRAGRKKGESGYIFLAMIAGAFSTFSKEVGVTVFGVFAAGDIIQAVTVHGQSAMKNKNVLGRLVCRTAMNFLCAVLLTALHLSLHGDTKVYRWTILENSVSLLENRSHKIMSYAHIGTLYLWKLIYPFQLSYDWGWPCISHVTKPSDARNVGTLLVALVGSAVCWHSLRQRNAILLWSLALMAIPFVPASNLVFPVGAELAERLLYLPSFGFCLGAGYLMAQLLHDHNAKEASKHAQLRQRVKGVSCILLCAYMVWMGIKTVHRCTEWATEEALFDSALRVCPKSLKVLNNYGSGFLETDPNHAIPYLEEAISLYAYYESAHFNKGLAHLNLGDPVQAINSFKRSLALDPSNTKVRTLLGGALLSHAKQLLNVGNAIEAKSQMQRALHLVDDSIMQIDANNPRALHLRCEIGNALGLDAEENIRFCLAALEANREDTANNIDDDLTLNQLGIIHKQTGRLIEAVDHFSRGLETNPNSYDIHVNLGSTHADLNNVDLANHHFERAQELATDPRLKALLLGNMGWLMECQGQRMSARKLYQDSIRLAQPNPHPQIVTNLRNVELYCESNPCD